MNGTEIEESDGGVTFDNEDMGGLTHSVKVLSDFNSQLNSIKEGTNDASIDQTQILSILKEKTHSLLPHIKTAEDLRSCEDALDMLLMTLSKTTLNADEDTFGYLGERKAITRRAKYAFEGK
jgi:hypothetical protein